MNLKCRNLSFSGIMRTTQADSTIKQDARNVGVTGKKCFRSGYIRRTALGKRAVGVALFMLCFSVFSSAAYAEPTVEETKDFITKLVEKYGNFIGSRRSRKVWGSKVDLFQEVHQKLKISFEGETMCVYHYLWYAATGDSNEYDYEIKLGNLTIKIRPGENSSEEGFGVVEDIEYRAPRIKFPGYDHAGIYFPKDRIESLRKAITYLSKKYDGKEKKQGNDNASSHFGLSICNSL